MAKACTHQKPAHQTPAYQSPVPAAQRLEKLAVAGRRRCSAVAADYHVGARQWPGDMGTIMKYDLLILATTRWAFRIVMREKFCEEDNEGHILIFILRS